LYDNTPTKVMMTVMTKTLIWLSMAHEVGLNSFI
jgi:hypothetical protein